MTYSTVASGLQSVSDQFAASAEASMALLYAMDSDGIPIFEPTTVVFPDGSRVEYETNIINGKTSLSVWYYWPDDTKSVERVYYVASQQPSSNRRIINMDVFLDDDFPCHTTGLSVLGSDIAAKLSASAATNTAYAEIANMGLNATQVAYDQLAAVLGAIPSLDAGLKNRLLAELSSVGGPDGLNGFTIAEYLGRASANAAAAVDSDSWELDTKQLGSPQQFMTTVLLGSFLTLVSICAAAVHPILALATMLAGTAVQAVTAALSFPDAVEVDPSATNGYLDTPVLYCVSSSVGALSGLGLFSQAAGPFDFYAWKTAESSDWSVNGFVGNGLKPEALVRNLRYAYETSIRPGTAGSYTVNCLPRAYGDRQPLTFQPGDYLTPSDFSSLRSDPDMYTRYLAFMVAGSIALAACQRPVAPSSFDVPDEPVEGSNEPFHWSLTGDTVAQITRSGLVESAIGRCVRWLAYEREGFDPESVGVFNWERADVANATLFLQAYFRKAVAPTGAVAEAHPEDDSIFPAGFLTYANPARLFIADGMFTEVGSVPGDRGASVPEVTSSQAKRALLTVAAITAVAGLLTSAVKRVIRKRSLISQTKAGEALRERRAAYLSNPTSENRQAYFSAYRKYERKAALFGWGSYNPVAGTFSSTPASSMSLSSALATDEDQSSLLLQDIYSSITGDAPSSPQ